MFASTTTVPIKPDKWDDLASIFNSFLKSRIGGPEGLKAAYLLRVPGTNDGMALALYDTEAQIKASAEPGGLFSEIVSQLAECFAGQPERTISEVVAAAE